MMDIARSFLQPKRTLSEEPRLDAATLNQTSKIERLARPISALARYRPHKLSEIREVSTSSRISLSRRHSLGCVHATDGAMENGQEDAENSHLNAANRHTSSASADLTHVSLAHPSSPRSDLKSLAPSALSLPINEIPTRRSSMSALSQILPEIYRPNLLGLHSGIPKTDAELAPGGCADSPVRRALAMGAQSSEALRASPSRTFVRTATPLHLLDDDNVRNTRLDMSVRLPSPLFVSGGTVEGQIELKIDANSNKKTQSKVLYISALSVDVIGVEEVEDGRRRIFLSLATELFDRRHPPPASVSSQTPEKGSELYWQTRPGSATLPFCINLPLKLGPPSYSSRQASIRYLLCPSAMIKIGGKRSAVRQTWSIQMLTTHNPEKALASLPSPLLAMDTLMLSHTPTVQSIKLTAGLHRQTWVGGGVIFTDIHIVNSTDKVLKRVELHLEKSLLRFSHSAAGTAERSANNLRLPAKVDTETVCRTSVKKSKEWNGVMPQASEVRTCELELPKGHVTIGSGRYFEVRYFVRVTVAVTRNKSISVQLPITIIHINSLDTMPNSLAQVAASIEAKRAMNRTRISSKDPRTTHSSVQTFTKTRPNVSANAKSTSSNMNSREIESLTHQLDNSPRRIEKTDAARSQHHSIAELSRGKENIRSESNSCPRHLTLRPSCYHCHLMFAEHATKQSPAVGPKLPRLQVSTSGLGFSETEFEMPPDSPRKVMLSERERQMLRQQHELRVQRQWSQQKRRDGTTQAEQRNAGSSFVGWTNVALLSDKLHEQRDFAENNYHPPTRILSQRKNIVFRPQRGPFRTSMEKRSRSKTNPERMRADCSEGGATTTRAAKPSRGLRSIDQRGKHRWSGCDLIENDVFGPKGISVEQGRMDGKLLA